MADKRISQLIERVDIANNDVLPIVASGATTTNKVTVSTLQTWMQDNLDVGVTSVGLSMPSAFVVSNSPVTSSGNISVAGAGTVSQYIRGDGSLADFPTISGGGSSVSYYLNGSVSQGTIGGIAYQEMNKVPILGAGTDFTIAADGYIASFITDAGDPALLQIPAGNWNFETYLQASSGGGTPSFYIELYKVDSGGTATLIASNSATPELISFGTVIHPYFSALAVPTTSLTLTDRLALRYYVTHSGRTITLHTENATLCQIITTFTTGLTALNGLTAQVQNLATGTSGTDFGITSSVSTHTFNLPTASATNRGALSSADWTTFNNKQNAGNYVTTDTTQSISGVKTFTGGALRISSGGLGGLPTRIVNAPVSSVALSGFNSIGFNGSNNLFITRETDTNGVILAFNNTDLRTYTLPNVSGTIALTSDLSSGYVPYSGAAASVNLGVYSITANAINSAGSGSTAGQINLRSDAFFSLVNGYGSIASGTTNQFNLYQTTGAGVFRGAILSLNSITASATRTYTLPDADGTLALTSSLSGYLPLTGGTLTGALNGTRASFSETFCEVRSLSTTTSDYANFIVDTNNNTDYRLQMVGFGTTASGTLAGISRAGNGFVVKSGGLLAIGTRDLNDLVLSTNEIERLRISSTGAATFSSSVSALSLDVISSSGVGSSTASGLARFITAGSSTGISVGQANSARRLDISSYNIAVTGEGLYLATLSNHPIYFSTNSVDKMIITSAGNVGIGTASPGARLHLGGFSGAVNQEKGLKLTNDAGTTVGLEVGNSNDSYVGTISASAFSIRTSNTERMSITSAGNVGIGAADSIVKLNVVGAGATSGTFAFYITNSTPAQLFSVRNDGNINTGLAAASPYNSATTGRTMVIEATGGLGYLVSTRESKANIESISNTDFVNQLNPVQFNYRKKDIESSAFTDELYENISYGFIADEVEKVNKELVFYNGDGTLAGVEYNNMIAILTKAVQELKTEIDSLKNQIK